jgi:hypothetical protein
MSNVPGMIDHPNPCATICAIAAGRPAPSPDAQGTVSAQELLNNISTVGAAVNPTGQVLLNYLEL